MGTSQKAYNDLVASGKANTQRAKILAAMLDSKRTAMMSYTRQELVRDTGIPINAVCGRVKELLDAGTIKVAFDSYCEVTGREVECLKVVE